LHLIQTRYLAGLEHRLAAVEKRLNETGNDSVPFSSPGQRSSIAGQERLARVQEGANPSSGGNTDEEGGHEDSTDGMGAIVFTDEEECGFFGRINSTR